ncbi:ABC transporter substrate-binding protein [Roseococcus microcysteis]|uniref:ABC transporter substrate-binding protein n=1 Tax=Roseococcus microcysteis TaxID=2771361 RepID=UPI00168AD9CF|nr:ABC transporter substrate-binding protein [Roseococcus microcysteis]
MKSFWQRATLGGLAAMGLALVAGQAQAQPRNQITIMREIDADRYDPARSTALAAGEVITMLSDTLVSMDYDMRTIRPGLAERWDVSEDGLTYTFHLRQGVTFCDGTPFTAEAMAFSLNRWIGRTTPRVTSPVAWRAGDVKEIRATGPHTLVYELNRPHSELLPNLAQFFASALDPAAVERLGDNFGVQGFNGTGPFCWESWTPRNQLVLTRHPNYRWGPPVMQNQGPAHVERIVWRVIPEAASRVAALQSNQADLTQYIPDAFIESLRRVPTVTIDTQPNYLWDTYLGFKVDRPVANDIAIRRAFHMAVDRPAMVRAVWSGNARPARGIINPTALDYYEAGDQGVPAFDPAAARRMLDEAGWRAGPDGVRVKDGQRATLTLFAINNLVNQRLGEIIQQAVRQVGIELRVQLFDATVAWGRLASQDFDVLFLSYPYISANDALNLYWHSRSRPTPNRMNWNDPQTDAWLEEGRSATDPAVRARAMADLQRQLNESSAWMNIAHNNLNLFSTRRVEGARAHGLYGIAIYKGLDLRVR